MKHIYSISFFLIVSLSAFSQSIISEIRNNSGIEAKGKINRIKESTSFFEKDTINKFLEVTTYDNHMNLLTIKRYDGNNKLIFSRTASYDNTYRIKSDQIKQWNNLTGYQTEYSKYEYSNNGDYVQTDSDSQGNIIKQFKFYFDENKNLIRLESYFGDGKLIGFEKASYDIDNNKVNIYLYNAKNQLLNTVNTQMKIDALKNKDNSLKFNEFGDLIYSENHLFAAKNLIDTYEYKYDKHNNWISQKEFLWNMNSDGELTNKTPETFKTRKIKYFK